MKPRNNAELAHHWAHSQAGVSGSCNNMSYDGPRLFSYGTQIGAWLTGPVGIKVFVLNAARFGNATCKHQAHAGRAIPDGCAVFRVNMPGLGTRMDAVESGKGLVAHYMAEARKPLPDKGRAKVAWAIEAEARHEAFLDARRAARTFRLSVPKDWRALRQNWAEALDILNHRAVQQAAKRTAKAEAKLEQQRNRVPIWLAGGHPGPVHDLPVMLRVVSDGGEGLEIQTSKGAFIPYEDGKRAFEFAASLRAREVAWRRNESEFKVGAYSLDSINENGIVAGCHRISWEELERFALREGWITAPLPTEHKPI